MKKYIRKIISKFRPPLDSAEIIRKKISLYKENGRIPWSDGYSEYKYKYIKDAIGSSDILKSFTNKTLSDKFGLGVDERSVEYPWIFSKLSNEKSILLDAGSTFNFDFIVEQPIIKKKDMTIYTFYPEANCYFKNKINYVYGDLRKLYFNDGVFDEIVSQSTIEHIDMDNSIYGYDEINTKEQKSYEYIKAVSEMIRVLKPGGKLLITFPFGKYEYHGFFQQFDDEMLQRILDLFSGKGVAEVDFFKYEKNGWRYGKKDELVNVESYNPHTGKGKGTDGAAHCRSVACIEFNKR